MGPFDVPEKKLNEWLQQMLNTMSNEALGVIDKAMEEQNLANRIEAMKFCMRFYKDINDAMGINNMEQAKDVPPEFLKRMIKVQ